MNAIFIGNISLNISFILYLIVYIPQIIHNRISQNIAQLSLWLHTLLYLSYSFDLVYGFSSQLPWQYKVVSIVGLSLVMLQHLQFLNFFIHQRALSLAKLNIGFLIFNLVLLYYFFGIAHGKVGVQTTAIFGTIARLCGLIYCLPQIIKNKYSQSGNAISVHFLYLNLTLAILDTISSWCLDWGWPNKLASPLNGIMMIIILWQAKKYKFDHGVALMERVARNQGYDPFRKNIG